MRADRSELANLLPQVDEQPPLVDGSGGFAYVTSPDETYVAPQLRPVSGPSARPSLVLVEARAAVGKSMLARHLSWATRGILWDLSNTFVGTGTLWGSLARAFGPMELNNIIGRTATGQFLLVLDALDEAEMHAEGYAFDAFLTDLRDMFAAARPLPGAVILGRTETVDYVELFLNESVPISRFQIEDFDRQLAYRFVDRRLDTGRVTDPEFSAGAHRKHEKLYEHARERLFDFLIDRLIPDREKSEEGRLSREWPTRIGSFLGYAPVLEAVAEYLASYSQNYPALVADLEGMEVHPYHSGNAQWDLLRTIVTRLLRREQEKVVTQVKHVIPETADIDWSSVYQPDEQCARVLGRISGRTDLQDYIASVPEEFAARYSEVLKNALPNHPFLGAFFGYANVVFRDFVHAWGLCSQENGVVSAVRSELRSSEYLPSPLLGPFVLAHSDNLPLPSVDGLDIGFIYESLLTQGDTDLYLYAEAHESGNVFIGSDPTADVAVFSVRNPNTAVVFWRRLIRAQIRGDIVVRLGFSERAFTLGPSVNIDCTMLEAPCRAIRVFAKEGNGEVQLAASVGYDGGTIEPELSKFGPGSLTVSWDAVRYPWAEYAVAPDAEAADRPLWTDWRVHDAFVFLCSIAQRFATSHRSARPLWGPAVFGPQFFRRRHAGASASAMLSWLVNKRIVITRSRDHFLDARRLYDEFGVRLFELCARTETPGALQLIRSYLADNELQTKGRG